MEFTKEELIILNHALILAIETWPANSAYSFLTSQVQKIEDAKKLLERIDQELGGE